MTRKKEEIPGIESRRHQRKEKRVSAMSMQVGLKPRGNLFGWVRVPSLSRGSKFKKRARLLRSFIGEEELTCEVRTGREMFSTSSMPKMSQKIRGHGKDC